MKNLLATLMAVFALFALTLAISSQPPDGKAKPGDKKQKDGGPDGKKGPPPFELGKVLPPHVRQQLELSDLQKDALRELENEVREKLLKILTPEQVRQVGEMKKKIGEGPVPGRDSGPKGDKGGKKKEMN